MGAHHPVTAIPYEDVPILRAVPFTVTDSSTWPVLLTPEHMAAIWKLSVKRVNLLARTGAFPGPAPLDGMPRRWRKVDVLRHVERRTA